MLTIARRGVSFFIRFLGLEGDSLACTCIQMRDLSKDAAKTIMSSSLCGMSTVLLGDLLSSVKLPTIDAIELGTLLPLYK